jgi:hypothetical protein
MGATVVYESMFGATRLAAEAIARGLSESMPVAVVRVHDAPRTGFGDLLIVGAPTHARSLPRDASRAEAATWPQRSGDQRVLEPDAGSPGVREWLDGLAIPGLHVAGFATRADASALLVGTAAKAIDRGLKAAGGWSIAPSDSFLVTADGGLIGGEPERAERWGRLLGQLISKAA